MPFKSEKQRRYLYANEPKLAKKWSNMYGKKITGLGGVVNNNVSTLKQISSELKNASKLHKGQALKIDNMLNATGLGNMSAEDILDRAFSQVYKQGYKDREDESLGMRRGAEKGKKQSYKDRRNESYGKFGKRDKEKKGKNKINKITGLGAVKPTISEIKKRTLKKAPYFFSKNTMKFFGQRMSDYKVKRSPKGKIFIFAPSYNDLPYTFMEFKNNDLIAQSGIYDSESEIKKYISKR